MSNEAGEINIQSVKGSAVAMLDIIRREKRGCRSSQYLAE